MGVFATVLGFSSVSKAQLPALDDLALEELLGQLGLGLEDLGGLDLNNLILLGDNPLSVEVLEAIKVLLPLDLSGEDTILTLIIDPDGDGPAGGLVLPISLGALTGGTPGDLPLGDTLDELLGGLLGGNDLLDGLLGDLLDLDDLLGGDLFDSGLLEFLGLDDLLDGLLGGILGGGTDLEDLLGDITLEQLLVILGDEGAILEGIGIDLGGTIDQLLTIVLKLLDDEETTVIEILPVVLQPDVTVGASGTALRGDNVYSAGGGQAFRTPRSTKASSRAFFGIENDGAVTDTFVARSRSFGYNPKDLKVVSGGNQTAAFRRGTFRKTLPKGGKFLVAVTAKNNKANKRPIQSFSVTAQSTNDFSKVDRAEWLSNSGRGR